MPTNQKSKMNFPGPTTKSSLQSDSNDKGHAVVIGGGIAGLLAARVLSDHFDQVTIIERDRFPKDPTPRPGVPQSRHLRALER